MDKATVIALAREAGFEFKDRAEPRLERFAALVAAAEREKVAKWMIASSYATGHGDTIEDLLAELGWQIKERIAAKREECAKVADSMASENEIGQFVLKDCAAAIRSRT